MGPPKVPKKSKRYIRRPHIKKFHKTDPPKNGNSDSKKQFQNFQKPKIQLKKDTLKFQKIKNIYKEASNRKVLQKQIPPPKVIIQFKIIIFKFSKNQKSNSKKSP